MTQDELKTLVGHAALDFVPSGADAVIGVGTGSTVNKFIDALGHALASGRLRLRGAVSSSEATTARLEAIGLPVLAAHEALELTVYIDGADEIDAKGHMIKGGGAALTREKIVAAQAAKFVCIADESKLVTNLGQFALPVEVIPMAAARVARQFETMAQKPLAGAHIRVGYDAVTAIVRMSGHAPLLTDNRQHILDVRGLAISDALAFEQEVNNWPGVVCVGIFARQRAHVCLLATTEGVRRLDF